MFERIKNLVRKGRRPKGICGGLWSGRRRREQKGSEAASVEPICDNSSQEHGTGTGVDASPELTEVLLFLVDLLDEIDRIPEVISSANPTVSLVRSRLEDRLLLSDAEIIRDDVWNPARQRAVEVNQAPGDSSGVEVVESRRSGLCIGGRVVRKQEVIVIKN